MCDKDNILAALSGRIDPDRIVVVVNERERYIEARVIIRNEDGSEKPIISITDNAIGPAGWSVVIHYDTGELLKSNLLAPTAEDIIKANLGYLLPPILRDAQAVFGIPVPLSKLPHVEEALISAAKEKYQNKST